MARERYGNGYKGRAASRRRRCAPTSRGFADHSRPFERRMVHEASSEMRLGRNERESCRALHPPDLSAGGRGGDNRAAAHRSHRSRAIGGVLMPHLYRRPGNHWKTPRRFDRRETEQEEESQPLRKTGTSRYLKDITKAKPRRRAPWK